MITNWNRWAVPCTICHIYFAWSCITIHVALMWISMHWPNCSNCGQAARECKYQAPYHRFATLAPLQRLELANTGINASDILQRLRPLRQLRLLNLKSNYLTAVDGLSDLRTNFPNLKTFELGSNLFMCTDFDRIWNIMKNQSINLGRYAPVCVPDSHSEA